VTRLLAGRAEARRDAGFSLFYLGINLGALAGPLPPARRPVIAVVAAGGVILVAVVAVTGILPARRLATAVVVLSAVAAATYFVVILSSRAVTAVERRRMFGFIPMFLASAVFWPLYQQQFTVVTIYSWTVRSPAGR
jgi:POT family proton-dependent oligopeptide transporter